MSRALQVLQTGPLTLVQDLGRPGLAALGAGRSGVADRGAFRLGARLLAQDYTAAALEVTFGGLAMRAHGDLMVALTGAAAPVTVDDRQVAHRSPLPLRDGETLEIGTPAVGLRTYLSVRGGVDVPAVLGSRATDTLSGIGPPSVKAGDLLPVGPPPRAFPVVDHAPAPGPTAGPLGSARAARPAGRLALRARRAGRSHLERVQPQRSGRNTARGAGAAPAPGARRTGASQRRRRTRSHPGPARR
jgi:allophanate hydrolase subunit 2